MISPEDFDEMASRFVAGAEGRYLGRVLERLTTSLVQGGRLTARDFHDIESIAAANRSALQTLLIRHRGAIAADAEREVRRALAESAANDMALLQAAYPSVAPIGATRLFQSVSAQAVQSVQSVIARQNIALAASAERLWYKVAADAVTAWQHGLGTMGDITAEAVRRLADGGLSAIDYRSGRRTATDAAIRRHMVSQAGQAAGRITMGYMGAYGHELVMTSAHFGSRPDHEPWQGKAFCTSGRKLVDGVLYPDFYKATGYGTVSGLLGVNCRHSFGPYYPGISKLPEAEAERDGMTSDEYYRATQRQRGLERAVRDKKREIALGQSCGLPMTQERLELGRLQGRLRAHTASKGLVRQPAREKAYGIGAQPRALRGGAHRTTFQMDRIKTADEFFSSIRPKNIEMGAIFDKDESLVRWFRGREHSIRFNIPSGYKASDMHFTHTHPAAYGGTLSPEDISSFTRAGLRRNSAVTHEGVYSIERAGRGKPTQLRRDYTKFHIAEDGRLKDSLAAECKVTSRRATLDDWVELDKKLKQNSHSWLEKNAGKYGYRYSFIPRKGV